MRRILSIAVVLLLLVVTNACINKNKPDKVAKAFLTALYEMNYDSAKTYCTSESYGYLEYRKLLDSFINKLEEKKNELPNINILSTKISGDSAECKYKLMGIPSEIPDEQTIDLVKRNGKWLVDLHAENLDFNNKMPLNDTINYQSDSTAVDF